MHVLYLICFMLNDNIILTHDEEYEADVVILGAGMAGVAAAWKLNQLTDDDMKMIVVEGGDRIGGRVKEAQFGGQTVELGNTLIG